MFQLQTGRSITMVKLVQECKKKKEKETQEHQPLVPVLH